MPILDEQERTFAQALIDATELCTCTLKQIYGPDWDLIPKKTTFGQRFKKAVEANELANIRVEKDKTSDNKRVYTILLPRHRS